MGVAEVLIALGAAIIAGVYIASRRQSRERAETKRRAPDPKLDHLAASRADDSTGTIFDATGPGEGPLPETEPLPVQTSGRYEIDYCDVYGEETTRMIDLRSLEDQGDDIMVQAWCHLRRDIRHFKASRIDALRDLETGEVIEDPDEVYEHFEALLDLGDVALAGSDNELAPRASPDMREVIFLDLETTGLNPKRDRILEIAAVRAVHGQSEHTSMTTLIDPGRKIPKKITEITGITDEMVKANGEPVEKALPDFIQFIGDRPVIAYNAPFDIGFLMAEAERHQIKIDLNYYCLLAEARSRLPQLARHRLTDLVEHFGIAVRQEHRALADVALTMEVYNRLMASY